MTGRAELTAAASGRRIIVRDGDRHVVAALPAGRRRVRPRDLRAAVMAVRAAMDARDYLGGGVYR